MKKIWKDVKGYEGLYQVSSCGIVKAIARQLVDINNMVKNRKELTLALTLDKYGYETLGLYKHGENKTVRVHRLVAEAFIDNPKNKKQVNHIDGCKANNNMSNLEWVTPSQNLKEAYRIGIKRTGLTHMKRRVKNTVTGQVYDSIRSAAKHLNLTDGKLRYDITVNKVPLVFIDPKRKIQVFDTATSIVYNSIADAAKHIGCSSGYLGQMLNKKVPNSTTLELF